MHSGRVLAAGCWLLAAGCWPWCFGWGKLKWSALATSWAVSMGSKITCLPLPYTPGLFTSATIAAWPLRSVPGLYCVVSCRDPRLSVATPPVPATSRDEAMLGAQIGVGGQCSWLEQQQLTRRAAPLHLGESPDCYILVSGGSSPEARTPKQPFSRGLMS